MRHRAVPAFILASAMFLTASQQRFEVVSVKPNVSLRREMRITPSPGGRLTATNVTLKTLIISAYDLEDWQLSGGPAWIDSDRFDINAKAATDVPASEAFHMLQGVLTDRFKLVSHRESKSVTGYTLFAGNALKFKAAAGNGEPRIMTGPVEGQKSLTQFSANNMSMQELAEALGHFLHSPVVDGTGLKGPFDFSFNVEMGEAEGPAPDIGPALVTAFREQLGLKIEAGKVSREVFVIDKVQKPSED